MVVRRSTPKALQRSETAELTNSVPLSEISTSGGLYLVKYSLCRMSAIVLPLLLLIGYVSAHPVRWSVGVNMYTCPFFDQGNGPIMSIPTY